ncbi:MAG: MerR family transcriptional regulator [Rickettsiales bacterium]|jgi:DNA-binding transcriptional MerR regulator|nr:MerR family transcriptional regulator [Rickettsiales bacterium]
MALLVDRKRSIGQASLEVGVQEHVLRFWETQFGEYIKPTIGNGGRRYFYDRDIKILKMIRSYLYDRGYTIRGLRNLMKNETIDLDGALAAEAPLAGEHSPGRARGEQQPARVVDGDGGGPRGYGDCGPSLRSELKNFKGRLNSFYEKLKNV